MKRSTSVAFLITLILYFLLAFLLWPLQQKKPVSKRSATSINLRTLNIKKPLPKPAVPKKPQPLKKPQKPLTKTEPKPKPKPHKKSVKKIKHIKKSVSKVTKPLKKDLNATKVARHTKKTFVPKKTVPKPPQAPSLSALFSASQPKKSKIIDLPKEYRKLYKDEFDTFTEDQKRFLKENLSRIGTITQKYLYLRGYPYIAVKTRQQGENAVEFWLHPNGDISGLRLIGSSGYEALDKNTIETIKAAYKDYPLPKQKTKVRIFVHYKLIY